MKIRIISRIGAESRRAFQAAQMQHLGLPFSFVDAVEATDLTDASCLEAAQTWPGATLPQDIACFHSHRKAWAEIVEDKALGLVLEDDAVLADTIASALAVIEERHREWRHVYDLEFTPEPHIIAERPTWQDASGKLSASRIYRNRVGLAGYVIGPEAAARMLSETPHYRLIDSYLWQRPWLQGQMIEPAQVVQMRFLPDAPETPAFVRSAEPRVFRPSSKARNFALKMEIELRRGISLLQAAGRSKRREPEIEWQRFSPKTTPG